jgi:hypothetical protein
VYYETKLEDMLEQFVNKGEHMAIVYEVTENDDSDNNYEIIGECRYSVEVGAALILL